ncbi:hypothetical protein D9M68_953960 [compost metagenome]
MQAFDALRLDFRRLLAVVHQPLQVASGAEVVALAGDDDAAHLRVVLGHVERLHASGVQVRPQGVAVLGVADGQHHGLAMAVAFEAGGHEV